MRERFLLPEELPLEREAVIALRLARRGAVLGDVRNVSWPRLVARARELGAVMALQQAIAGAPEVPVPDDARRTIAALARQASFAQLYLRQRLEQSLDALAGAGVQCMPLKGAAFVLADPAGTAARTMGDIDLLVFARDAAAARTALLASGWVTSMFESREAFYAEHHHLAPFDDANGSGLSIEVHTEPLSPWHPFGLRASSFWATGVAHPTRAGLMMPSRREQLLHACLHFAWAHMGEFGAWRLARDVDALVADGLVDWSEFVRTAREQRAGTTCYWALRFAREAAGIAIPDEVLSALAPSLPAVMRRGLGRHLSLRATAGTAATFPSVRLQRFLWELMIQPARSGHGTVRPWAHDDGQYAAEARHLRSPAPTLPWRSRARLLTAHLWRSIGGRVGTPSMMPMPGAVDAGNHAG